MTIQTKKDAVTIRTVIQRLMAGPNVDLDKKLDNLKRHGHNHTTTVVSLEAEAAKQFRLYVMAEVVPALNALLPLTERVTL